MISDNQRLIYWEGDGGPVSRDGENSCHGPGRGVIYVTERCSHFPQVEIAKAREWMKHCDETGIRPGAHTMGSLA